MKLPNNLLAVIPDKPLEQTKSGLFIPESAQQPTYTGTVYEIGTKVQGHYQKGQKVLYQYKSGVTIEHDGNELVLVPEGNILGKE